MLTINYRQMYLFHALVVTNLYQFTNKCTIFVSMPFVTLEHKKLLLVSIPVRSSSESMYIKSSYMKH
jgi:hypothetical protein